MVAQSLTCGSSGVCHGRGGGATIGGNEQCNNNTAMGGAVTGDMNEIMDFRGLSFQNSFIKLL